MREIKFRTWIKAGNIMYEPITLLQIGNGWGSSTITFNQHGQIDERYCVLMQYTGYKDKNDVEIYEGDILKFTHYFPQASSIVEVVFEQGCFYMKEKCYRDPSSLDEQRYVWTLIHTPYNLNINHKKLMYELEVIGNIYEHSGLLVR